MKAIHGFRRPLWLLLVSGLLALGSGACTTTHAVRTIGKGNVGIEGNFGGPVFTNLDAPIPTPNLYAGARYGILDQLDVSAHYNLTGPFIPGIGFNFIASGHWVPLQPGLGSQRDTPDKGWSVAGTLSLHSISDFQHGYLVVPVMEWAAGWRHKWFNPYLGMALGLNFYRPFDETNIFQLSPYLGCDFIVSRRVSLSLRWTIYDVAYNLYGAQLEWVYLVDDLSAKKRYGPMGLSLGFAFDFINPPSAGGTR